jgi:STE24 endopeptidase
LKAFVACLAALLLASTVAHAESAVAVPPSPPGAIAFLQTRDIFWAAAQIFALAIPAFFLFTGLGARLRSFCALLVGGRWYGTVALFACAYLFFAGLITLPFDYYRDFSSMHAAGMSHQSLPEWLMSEIVQLVVKLVAAVLFAWVPYALIAKSPRCWWLYATLALIPIVFLALVILPVWVSPLTTTYKPLANKKLEARIETLAARCGVYHIPVFIGGNDDTVVGLGPTNRIILDRDIYKTENPDQIEFTVGHELKHYLKGDNYKALAIIAGLMLAGFWLADRLGRAWLARFASPPRADSDAVLALRDAVLQPVRTPHRTRGRPLRARADA